LPSTKSFAGVVEMTKVPRPVSVLVSPSVAEERRTSRMTERLTPKDAASEASEPSFEPMGISPDSIPWRIELKTSSAALVRESTVWRGVQWSDRFVTQDNALWCALRQQANVAFADILLNLACITATF